MSDEQPKKTVEQAYDNIAEWYLDWAVSQPSPRDLYTQKLLASTPSSPPPHILELGCAAGLPITRLLLDSGAKVTANDISSKQIGMARTRCPEATFIAGDMATALAFDDATFDGATCFYTIFHLPRAEQRNMLAKIYAWLKPGALFVLNFATVDEAEIYGEMMGHGLFWSSFGTEESERMVVDVGFEVVEASVLEAGDGKLEESDPDYGVKFMWVVARKN